MNKEYKITKGHVKRNKFSAICCPSHFTKKISLMNNFFDLDKNHAPETQLAKQFFFTLIGTVRLVLKTLDGNVFYCFLFWKCAG